MTEWLPLLVGAFLVVALSAYVLFGGADFGGGLLEVTLPKHLRPRLEATLAPVWEANHVWLIAVVVILFVGFPRLYAASMTRLYVPISLALLAIVLRGTFFTLRKYDPAPGKWLPWYSLLFSASSLLAPLCFGFVVAGLLAVHPGSIGAVPTDASFHTVYVAPWFDAFGLVTGAFVASLFGYLAAVFFYGELDNDEDRAVLAKRIQAFFAAAFVLGGLTLGAGLSTGRVTMTSGLGPVQLGAQLVAGLGIAIGTRSLRKNHAWGLRFAAGAQVVAILGGWFATQYPVLLRTEAGPLTLASAAAPPVTLLWLALGLTVVLGLTIPLLVWLYRVFAERSVAHDSSHH